MTLSRHDFAGRTLEDLAAHGLLDLVPSQRPREPDFALYLDKRWDDGPQVTWPFRIIGWEDFGLPVDEAEIFTAIANLYRRARARELVEVACYGGVGRTGTMLGALRATSRGPPTVRKRRASVLFRVPPLLLMQVRGYF